MVLTKTQLREGFRGASNKMASWPRWKRDWAERPLYNHSNLTEAKRMPEEEQDQSHAMLKRLKYLANKAAEHWEQNIHERSTHPSDDLKELEEFRTLVTRLVGDTPKA